MDERRGRDLTVDARPQLGPELSRAAMLMQDGRIAQAEAVCRARLEQHPRDVDAFQMLGLIASMAGRLEQAVSWFERGLEIAPKTPMLLSGLGKAHTTAGNYDAALDAFDRAIAVNPLDEMALAGKADLLEHRGAFDEARAVLQPVMDRGGEHAESALIYATLEQRAKRDDNAVRILERHLAGPNPPITARKMLFTIGKSYERLERYDDAFAAFAKANELQQMPFDIRNVRGRFDRVRKAFSPEALRTLARARNDSELPIFVVSMPRSGSTLVEQILAAHPSVHGAGEIDAMIKRLRSLPDVVDSRLPYPELVRDMTEPQARAVGEAYLDVVRPLAPDAKRIVDKNLQNFRLLGLIQMVLPKARVIWCQRDPMSICFSCFQLPLSPVALPYSTDLTRLGQFYRAYEELMRYWVDTLDLAILPVQYEELVADQERVSRAIIDFAGLPWDDACLQFHRTKRDVATASYDQVRQPIYRAAVDRFRNYETHLEPLRKALVGEA